MTLRSIKPHYLSVCWYKLNYSVQLKHFSKEQRNAISVLLLNLFVRYKRKGKKKNVSLEPIIVITVCPLGG